MAPSHNFIFLLKIKTEHCKKGQKMISSYKLYQSIQVLCNQVSVFLNEPPWHDLKKWERYQCQLILSKLSAYTDQLCKFVN